MKQKVGVIHSIRTKLCLLVALAILITGILMILTYSPNVKEEVASITQNYLYDLSVSYGMVVEDEIENIGIDEALTSKELERHLSGVGLEGVESSYVYVVSPDGTMLYHPTAEKIGQPVENEVIKGVTSDLQAGKKVENKVVSYEFKGAVKYAAYYVNDNADFILIVTTDEDEIFEPVDNINFRGRIGLLISFVICFIIAIAFITVMIINPIFKIEALTERVAGMDFSQSEEQA